MKKNIFLIIILSSLISLAYFWEHLELKNNFTTEKKLEKLIELNTSDVVEITLKNAKLLKKDGKWFVGELNFPASLLNVQTLLDSMEGLSIVSEIQVPDDKNVDEFFMHQDHSFRIKTFNKDYAFRLGDISPITGDFYLESYALGKKQLFLVKNVNIFEGIYRNELESEFQKYLLFKNLVVSEPMALIETQFMPELKMTDIQTLKIDNRINRWFEVNFVNQTTTPSIYPGLEYKDLALHFSQLWSKVKITKFFDIGKNVLSENLSTITLLNNQSSIKIMLYGLLNDIAGYYAVIENDPRIYQLDEKSRDLFFSNVQDFWWKQHFSKKFINTLTKFDFKIGINNNYYNFNVDDIKIFEITTSDSRINKINANNMNLLFNLIFNLVEFEEAKFIQTELTKTQPNTFIFEMDLLGKNLKIRFQENLITVQDLSGKLEYAYPHRIPGIEINQLTDFFTLK